MSEDKMMRNDMKNIYKLLLAEFSNPVHLTTLKQKKAFKLYSEKGKLFVRNSEDSNRYIDEKSTIKFYDEFKRTGSDSPKTYLDLTRHSSYLLAAIYYLKEKGSL